MASTPLGRLILTFLAVLLFPTAFCSAETSKDSTFIGPKSPRTEAEKLVRAFNLFPEHRVNRHVHEDSEYEFRMEEKRVQFPFLLDSGSAQGLVHRAGYYKLQDTRDARMFYYFFESRSSGKDPVVIWLTGGPGCGSELALFYENGPFHITSNLSLTVNEFGWDKVSNLIFVDQPTGTGFSYSSDEKDARHDEEGVSNDLYHFLQAFFKGHPEFIENDFYIAGESYAGHYIPALASRIQHGNRNKEGIHINLKGLAIGNGLTNPGIQYAAYSDYALMMKLISQSDHESLKSLVLQCVKEAGLCGADGGSGCLSARTTCNNIFESILDANGNINYYDIRKQCEGDLCYDFSNMERFLKLEDVRNALGVGDIEFVSCSTEVYENMEADWMRNLEVGIPALLEDGTKLLVYAGEYDLICNWLGNSRWTEAMEWSGQKNYAAASLAPFTVDGKEAGLQKSYGPLTFVKVHDAGHLVPMDQPKVSIEMLTTWMKGQAPLTEADSNHPASGDKSR